MPRSLAFFYRRTQLSGRIRRQMAPLLGAKINPKGGVEDDVCIGVKMSPGLLYHDKLILRSQMGDYYLDFIDHSTSLPFLSHWPDIKIIVCSRSSEQWLGEHLKNPLTYIPQHHCNIERQHRPSRPVRTVSYIGLSRGLPPWHDQVTEAVRKMGLEFRYFTEFQDRPDVVQAYLHTDIQFQWCEGMPDRLAYTKNPMRVINGLSFGIPMVSNPLPAYLAECPGHCVTVPTIPEALDQIYDLSRNDTRYGWYQEHGPAFAEPYHITNIAEMFRCLTSPS